MRGSFSRLRTSILVGLLLASALSPLPAHGAEEAAHPGLSDQSGAAIVTLITGDRVQVAPAGGGRTSLTMLPAVDGSRANVRVIEHNDDLFVFPLDVLPYIAAGSLDRELFNVTQLLADGRGDDGATLLPLIVAYADAPGVRAVADRPIPTHSTRSASLESIGAVAITARKDQSTEFWADLRRHLSTTDHPGQIEKVWLDSVLRADLADSVPQIGAPQAWSAGFDGNGVTVAVLDTGYDPTHPDLDEQVSGHADFTGGSDSVDRHGHGTHVAATIAGTGAASGRKRNGVAPGASLIIGKVLGDNGSGELSWVIDGMEWAAAQGADVVNMSLSADATGSSDALTEAVDELTRTTGTLFVAAAGNTGPFPQTVRTPGIADSALSVGAVDKADRLADFSSRGPRPGDHALKPDITGPGVDIVAARAAGTSIGSPIDSYYTSLSGTSMATPHVAGSAAVLAQQHPDWSPAELKDALITSAHTAGGYGVYEQGGGRVDIARAVIQPVQARPGTIDFGTYEPSDSGDLPTASETITYRNAGDNAVVLDLSLDLSGESGVAVPSGMFSLSHSTVTVPANGAAQVELTLDPNLGDPDLYGGYVVASSTAADVRLHTSVGVYKQPRMVEVTVEALAEDGSAPAPGSAVDLWNLDTDAWETGFFGGKGKGSAGPAVLRVPEGTYSVMAFVFTGDESGRAALEVALVGDPEVNITDSVTISLDGRNASPVEVDTPWATEQRGVTVGYYRESERHSFNLRYLLDRYFNTIYAAPTEGVDRGTFEFTTQWELLAPEFALRALAPTEQELDAEYTVGSPRVDGRHVLDAVDAGSAFAADLAGVDLTGKLALVQRTDELPIDAQVRAVAEAGAKAAVVYHDQPGWLLGDVSSGSPIPSFTIRQADGVRLLGRLATDGRLAMEIRGTAVSPYLYDLMFAEPGTIPADLSYGVDHDDLARLDTQYVSTAAAHPGAETRFAFRPYDNFALRIPRDLPVPSQRTEWVSPGDTAWREVAWPVRLAGGMAEALRTYEAGEIDPRAWFEPIVRPGVPDDIEYYGDSGLPGYREGNQFTIAIRDFLDSHGHWTNAGGADTSQARLFRDGTLVATRDGVYGDWPADPDPATYRLELDVTRSAWWWQHSTATRTAWTFESESPGDGERARLGLLQVDYAVDLDLSGAAKASAPSVLRMDVHRQAEPNANEQFGLRLWVSYDAGKSWQPVGDVARTGPSEFTAVLRHPAGADGVSLRVEAWDGKGSSIEQTIERAFPIALRR